MSGQGFSVQILFWYYHKTGNCHYYCNTVNFQKNLQLNVVHIVVLESD